MAAVIVSLHDVAPATAQQSVEMLSMVSLYGLRATLLVIPGPFRGQTLADDDGTFARWLRDAEGNGNELAQHGWAHEGARDPRGNVGVLRRLEGRALARGCAEFLELGIVEATRRILAGREVLDAAGIHPVGFTPPGWLASRDTLCALRRLRYRYTTTQWSIVDVVRTETHYVGALSQRPGSTIAGVAAVANQRVARALISRDRPLRIALHPDDFASPRLRDATHRILASAAQHGKSMTYIEFLDAATRPETTQVA